MPVLMFWNIANKDLSIEIAEACHEYSVDVLILAECELSTKTAVVPLNQLGGGFYEEAFSPVETRLRVFTKLPTEWLRPVLDDDKISVRCLRTPIGPEITIAAMHLRSKLHADASDQRLGATMMRDAIALAESNVGHKNTIVIGDFNMNPFEPGMVAADGFHGLMDKAIAKGGSRIVQGKEFDYFYNPMWSRLGDESGGPPRDVLSQ